MGCIYITNIIMNVYCTSIPIRNTVRYNHLLRDACSAGWKRHEIDA